MCSKGWGALLIVMLVALISSNLPLVSGAGIVAVADGLTLTDWAQIQSRLPQRANTMWRQQAKLIADDAAEEDVFSSSVAVDGDTVVVGARLDDDGGRASGAAYVFTRSGTTWSQEAKLTAADASRLDTFGSSVAVDGDTAVIGAPMDADGGPQRGSAYVFTRSGTTWSQQAKLHVDDVAAMAYFGSSVAVDGDTVVIGARQDDDGGAYSGSAYVFTRSGTAWSQQAKLNAADAAGDDFFGTSVALDGDTALIGAQGNDDDGAFSGSAYVFIRSGAMWSQQAKLTADDAAEGDSFGWSVAVDGDTAVISAGGDDDVGEDSGAAYVFTRSGTIWSQQAKLTAADAAGDDLFGFSVALDGDTAVIGARQDDDGGEDSGAAYVFTHSGTTWSQQAKLTAADAAENDRFGTRLALDGDTAVIATSRYIDGGGYGGSAYVFSSVPGFPFAAYMPIVKK